MSQSSKEAHGKTVQTTYSKLCMAVIQPPGQTKFIFLKHQGQQRSKGHPKVQLRFTDFKLPLLVEEPLRNCLQFFSRSSGQEVKVSRGQISQISVQPLRKCLQLFLRSSGKEVKVSRGQKVTISKKAHGQTLRATYSKFDMSISQPSAQTKVIFSKRQSQVGSGQRRSKSHPKIQNRFTDFKLPLLVEEPLRKCLQLFPSSLGKEVKVSRGQKVTNFKESSRPDRSSHVLQI